MGEDCEKDESESAAGDAAPCHHGLARLGHGASDVPALEESADDTDGSDEHAILRVGPVEY